MDVVALLLAAGDSERMGSPKALLPWHDQPLLSHQLQQIRRSGVRECVVVLGRDPDRARVLCIGDGMGTDVRGANAQALDVLFIAAGIHGGDIVRDGKVDAAIAEHMLAVDGLHAAWAMADLVW